MFGIEHFCLVNGNAVARKIESIKFDIMLEMVSWKEYISLVLMGLVVYYAYMLVKYYPNELRRVILKRKDSKEEEEPEEKEQETDEEDSQENRDGKGDPRKSTTIENPLVKERLNVGSASEKNELGQPPFVPLPQGKTAPTDIIPRVEEQPLSLIAHTLSGEIKKLVEWAAREKMIREELMMAFQLLLTKDPYWVLGKGPFKESINNLIRFDVENNCSIRFDADEVNGLWVR